MWQRGVMKLRAEHQLLDTWNVRSQHCFHSGYFSASIITQRLCSVNCRKIHVHHIIWSCGWSSIICKQAQYFSVSGPAGDRWGCRHSAAVLRWRKSKPLTCLQDPSVSDSRGLTRSFRCASSCLDDVVFVLRDSMSPSFSANICYSGVVLYNFHRQEGRSRTPQASLTPHHWIFMRIFK